MRSSLSRLTVAVLAAAALGLVACGDDEEETASAGSEPAATEAAEPAAKPLTIGIPQPFGGDQGTLAVTAGVTCAVKENGGEVKTADANIDPNKQISDFNSLLAQGVDGVVSIPLNDQGLAASYKKAKEDGIATVTVGPSAPNSETGAVVGDFNGDLAAAAADAIADAKPGAKVLIIGGPPQIPAVAQRHEGFKAQAKARGLKVLEQKNSMKATPDDARSLANTMLNAHPDADAIWGVNSDIASGGGLAASKAGKDVYVVGIAASPVAIKQLEAGNIDAIVDDRSFETGQDAAKAIAAQSGGEEFTPAPFQSTVYTKDNAGEYVPFDKRC